MASSVNIKRPGANDEYSPQLIQELVRCGSDAIYFIENYVKVQHPTKGTVPMVLYDYQKEMIDCIHNNKDSIILASRQLGKCFSGDTLINTVKKPRGFRKFLLKFLDSKTHDALFK